MNTTAWNTVHKVLCVRLDSLGDVLMCTPAIGALAQSPRARSLTLLTSPGGAAAGPHIHALDAVIEYTAPWMKSGATHAPADDVALIERLAAQCFDAAVIFTSYSQSALPAALLCYFARIPLRLAHCRENPYQLLTHWVPDREPGALLRHEVRRQLDLVASVGCNAVDAPLAFALSPSDLAMVSLRLAELGIGPDQPYVLMHPGASAPSRRYPPAHWAEAIRQLRQRSAWPVVLTGDVHETELIEHICASSGAYSLAGQLKLGQLGAAIRLAAVVVSNNTGPAHMAAALGTPLVDLYALTNPQHTPWQVENRLLFHDVPCRYCYKSECPQGHHDCLTRIAPERVVDAVCSLMASKARRP